MTTRVAAVQLEPVLGDLPGNLGRITGAIERTLIDGARIVVLPELATSGYVFADRAEARRLAIDADHAVFGRWAALLGDAVLVVGFAERGAEGRVHNSAAVVDGGGVRAVYRKVHLWDRERLVFTAGDGPPAIVDTPHGRIGAMICFDLEFPEWTRIAALAGAELLAVPASWPLPDGEEAGADPEVPVTGAVARLNRMAVALADRCGGERGVRFRGGTHLLDAGGRIRARVGAGSGAAVADLDLAAARDKRDGELVDLFADRRPELYGALLGRFGR